MGAHQDMDDGTSQKKSKPFRIKDMSGDYMNNTGISTTTSSNTNHTMPVSGTSRRDFNTEKSNFYFWFLVKF